MTNADRCPDCGAMYALIGFRHRCNPNGRTDEALAREARATVGVATPLCGGDRTTAALVQAGVGSERSSPVRGIYKYRDPEKWRAYMRDYMRKRRGTSQTIE